ncbi:hypothetical protein LX32DRAFT_426262 [Colletotrichum zoysiae]|uniref:Uncharacterized protein n=1 Tax=Colletotrichum zoysiae TaxID=1216348 RepID=A0AAD9LZ34_9PEZI|nr:hypothetical protein LX32DRAFT_426262 [Colletotrichum zoysiae]
MESPRLAQTGALSLDEDRRETNWRRNTALSGSRTLPHTGLVAFFFSRVPGSQEPPLFHPSVSVLLFNGPIPRALPLLGLVYAPPIYTKASEAPVRCWPFSFSLWLASWLTQVAAHFAIHHGGRLRRTFISHRIHNLAPMHVPHPSPLFVPALEHVAYRDAVGTGCGL